MKIIRTEQQGNIRTVRILKLIKFSYKRDRYEDDKKPKYESYSQLGEDTLLRSFFNTFLEQNPHYKGFYIDIGAHHPFRFSNTAIFHKMGWSGINIDPTPSAIEAFKKHRPQDTNLLTGVGFNDCELDFYMFEDHAINSFSKEFADNFINDKTRDWKFLGIKKIPVMPLKKILENNLPNDQKIDFFNIDTEGLDLEVLESNDWDKYSPTFILIEIHGCSTVDEVLKSPSARFLKIKGYELVGQTLCTSLFKKMSF